MTKLEHNLLVAIHERVHELPTTADLNRAKRTIIKTVITNRKSEVDQNGPTTVVRQRQVQAVRTILMQAYGEGRSLSLHAACLQAWEPLTGGYPTPKALYEYCHEHENEF